MDDNYQIDKTDRQILALLQQDARMAYLDIARKILVSGGTVHQRVDKLKKLGIIKGSKINLDYRKLGHDVTVFLGVHLTSTKDLSPVIEKMRTFNEVIEVHYTTGDFALLIKVRTKSISDFHQFLTQKLQGLEGIRATESFVILDSPIDRDINMLEGKHSHN